LFELCAQLEGHPDNAAPAAFGGFTVAKPGAPALRCEVAPTLHFVLLVPGFEISTPAARAVLPPQIDHKAAAASLANACRITAAFALQRYDLLRGCLTDWLHQPYRESLIPMLPRVIAAGEKAEALAGFLSGSGSTYLLSDPSKIRMPLPPPCSGPLIDRLGRSSPAQIITARAWSRREVTSNE
jgi:homoserine kinase